MLKRTVKANFLLSNISCFRAVSSQYAPNVNEFTVRTHNCGELRQGNEGEVVEICGWLHNKRMNRFLILRDAYGTTQAILPDSKLAKFGKLFNSLTYESVLQIKGLVRSRLGAKNPDMKTGDIEVEIEDLVVMNESNPNMPVSSDQNSLEKTKLKYRYLDLRSEKNQSIFRLRSRLTSNIRKFFESMCFVEIETPTLSQWTPGGAAEFVVPASKPNLGFFYSLPQSPQLYKQFLMCGGMDRYYQLARCYRDETTKIDRQPEFTQVDFELSFTSMENVMMLVEKLIVSIWPDSLDTYKEMFVHPFPRIKYRDALQDYGTDKPDLRIPWKILDCPAKMSSALKTSVEKKEGFSARMFIAKGTRKHCTENQINEWKLRIARNPHKQPFEIFIPSSKTFYNNWDIDFDTNELINKYNIEPDDAIVLSWGEWNNVQLTLGYLRNYLADTIGLRKQKEFKFAWIVDFPLFQEKDGGYECLHHPFTAPIDSDLENLKNLKNLHLLTAQHYDLVLNGVELGGGTIRINNSELQRLVFEKILKLPINHLEPFFEALSYGAPPHGGFALGLDRFVALLSHHGDVHNSIRDVIAFPKSHDGKCFLMGAPNKLPLDALKRYGIK